MGGTSESDGVGACDLEGTLRAPTSVEDIWLGITLVETDHSSGAGAAAATGRDYMPGTNVCWRHFDQYQRLLEIFGQGPCWFGIFRLRSESVEDVDAPIEVPGEDVPCGYVGI